MFRPIVAAWVIAGASYWGLLTPSVAGDPNDFGKTPASGHIPYQVLDAMWKAQAYQTAHRYCRDQIAIYPPGSDPHALWTIWYLEGLGRQSVDEAKDADQLNAQMAEIVKRFQEGGSKLKRLSWIQLQQLRSRWIQAQYHLALFLASNSRENERDLALDLVRSLLEEIDQLKERVAEQSSLASRPSSTAATTINVRQFQNLMGDIYLLEVDCFRIRSECHPPQSKDRLAAVYGMKEAIKEAGLRVSPDWRGRTRLQWVLADGMILNGEYAEALRILDALQSATLDEDQRLRVLALRAKSHRLTNAHEKAKEILAGLDWRQSPYVALEMLEQRLQQILSETTSGQATGPAKEAMGKAIEFKNMIGNFHGSYWLQRFEATLLSRSKPGSAMDSIARSDTLLGLQLLKTEAKQLLAAGKIEEGIEKLSLAERKAIDEQSEELSFSLGVEIAALLQSQNRIEEAIEQYRRVALRIPTHPKASSTHLMSCWLTSNQFKGLRSGESLPQRFQDRYLDLLSEHHTTWGDSATAPQSRLWFDQFACASGRLGQSVDLWQESLRDQAKDPNVLGMAIGRTLLEVIGYKIGLQDHYEVGRIDRLISKLHEANRPGQGSKEILELAQLWIARFAVDYRWDTPARASPLYTNSAFPAGVPIRSTAPMDKQERDPYASFFQWSIEMLERVVRREGPSLNDISTIESLRSHKVLQPMAWPFLDVLFDVVEGMPLEIKAKWRPVLSKGAEWTVDSEIPISWVQPFEQQRKWINLRMLGWDQDRTEAGAAWNQVKKSEDGKSRSALRQRAAFLAEEVSPDNRKAIDAYQELSSIAKPGSELWIEGRYLLARELRNGGKVKEAKQTLDFILSTYPDLSKEWKSRFEKLKNP